MRTGILLAAIAFMLMLSGLVLAAPTQTPVVNQPTVVPAKNLELVGHVGGQVRAVVLSGTLAYVGLNEEFSVIDISDPALPVRLGSLIFEDNDYWLDNSIYRIVLTGHYAVVATWDGLVRLIDVGDPTRPVVVGKIRLMDSVEDLAADTHYVYLLGSGSRTVPNGLRIIDISDPTVPVLTGFFPAAYSYGYVAVSGSYAFLYEDYGPYGPKIHTVDLTDPAHPVKIGEYSISAGWVWDMVAYDHELAVVIEDYYSDPYYAATLHLLDATQPATLTQVSAVALHSLITGEDYYGDLSTQANRIYVADATLQIIDVADPAHPIWRGEYAGPTVGANGSVSGNRAVVGTQGRGWRILDVTNAAHPVELGAYDPPSAAVAAALAGNIVYVANAAYGLRAVDITDPHNPAVLPVVPPGMVDVVHTSSNKAYVLARPNELRVLDVANPANPITLKTYTFGGQMEDFEIAGQYIYVADAAYGLRVYNISQPTAWTSASNVPMLGAHDVAIEGTHAYILAVDAGGEALYILNIADPIHPALISIWRPSHGQLTALWVDNQVAYVTYRAQWYEYSIDTGLMIVDVSDPAGPHQLGERIVYSAGSDDPVVSVSVAGRLAYLTQPFSGVRVLDVSVPAQPTELEQDFTLGPTWNVLAAGDRVFINAQGGGLSVYEQHGNAAGQLLDGARLPVGLPNVNISAGGSLSTTTNVNGSYDLRPLPVGLNTITPTLAGYVFMPPTVTFQTPSAYVGALNFVALVAPMTITVTPGMTATLAYTEANGASIEAVFPADALSQTTTLTATPMIADDAPDWWFTGHAFDLAPSIGLRPNLTFNVPVTITVRYADRDVQVVRDESALRLMRWSGSAWEDAATTCEPDSTYVRDLDNNMLTVEVCDTGRYALFGPTYQAYLPLNRR